MHDSIFLTIHNECKLFTIVIQIYHPFIVNMVMAKIHQTLNAHNSSLENDELPSLYNV
jgi:hypothetical protein